MHAASAQKADVKLASHGHSSHHTAMQTPICNQQTEAAAAAASALCDLCVMPCKL
jgi:hypothetical protein